MTYEEYRAEALQRAQSVDWGRPPRPGAPWPVRLLPLAQAVHLIGTQARSLPRKYGMIRTVDTFQLRAYFEAKEKRQDRDKLK